jgi:hypothetical protein
MLTYGCGIEEEMIFRVFNSVLSVCKNVRENLLPIPFQQAWEEK